MRNQLLRLLNYLYFNKIYIIVLFLMIFVLCLALQQFNLLFLIIFMFMIVLYLACHPKSLIHSISIFPKTRLKTIGTVFIAFLTVACCVLPMDNLDRWNGKKPNHRNQYELMADAILNGRLYIEYGDEDELKKLDNPYDPKEREENGVSYHWDHAYYDGHYYMYFGVVPVFLVFLPYRVLTGQSLTTFHATQFFVGVFVFGIFALFYLLSKLFFKKIPYAVYLMLSVAFSVMSVWYSVAEPALYCTAITSAIALEIWSFFFFVKAVWGTQVENKQILYATIGALLGALAFGCRPPIALANLAIIPMLVVFLRQRKFTAFVFGKLLLVALPYVIVAILLMLYNYVRFDNPLEFGQIYQLTVVDQSQYGFSLSIGLLVRMYHETIKNFFEIVPFSKEFPYLTYGGMFFNFPILLSALLIFKSSVYKKLKENRLVLFTIGLMATVLIITLMDIMWTPYLLERYRMDTYYLMAIVCFMCIGLWHNASSIKQRIIINAIVIFLSVITLISSMLFYIRTVDVYYPEEVDKIEQQLIPW